MSTSLVDHIAANIELSAEDVRLARGQLLQLDHVMKWQQSGRPAVGGAFDRAVTAVIDWSDVNEDMRYLVQDLAERQGVKQTDMARAILIAVEL